MYEVIRVPHSARSRCWKCAYTSQILTNITAGALQIWRRERGAIPARSSAEEVHNSASSTAPRPTGSGLVCERIVVFNKRDLVPEWGIEVSQHSVTSRATSDRKTAVAFQTSSGCEIPRPKDLLRVLEQAARYQGSERAPCRYGAFENQVSAHIDK